MDGDSVYTKGSLLGSDKDWYHGQLTRVEAEQALTACGYDCFLIRENRGALVLSLIHHVQICHIKIEHNPSGYRLQGSLQKSFEELQDLVTYYHTVPISDSPWMILGLTCMKTHTSRQDTVSYTTIRDIFPSKPTDLTECYWYHGKMSREWAEWILGPGECNKFLVRQSDDNDRYVLSMKISGWMYHDTIKCKSRGYKLKGRKETFRSIPDMITYYQKTPVKKKQVLGSACDRKSLALQVITSAHPESKPVFKKEGSLFRMMWRRCTDIPVATSAPQVVRIGGHIYVGGGYRHPGATKTIFHYDLKEDAWTGLPPCPTYQHGLTKLSGKLVAIGGTLVGASGTKTGQAFTLQDGTWKETLPPMPTARCLPSTISYEDRLIIAAGGMVSRSDGKSSRTDTVEIFLIHRQWYKTKSLPFPMYTFSMRIIGDRCYILGGVGTPDQSCATLFSTLYSLLENAEPPAETDYTLLQCPAMWDRFKGQHPLPSATLVEVDRRLVALGGEKWTHLSIHGTQHVSTYSFATDTWVECKGAELPLPLYRPGVVKLDDDEVMVIGGESKIQNFTASVFIGETLGLLQVHKSNSI